MKWNEMFRFTYPDYFPPWYILCWRMIWVWPALVFWGAAFLFAVIMLLDVKKAVEWMRDYC